MRGISQRANRVFGDLRLASAFAGFAAGCSDIQPEPNDEGGGDLQSPTHVAVARTVTLRRRG